MKLYSFPVFLIALLVANIYAYMIDSEQSIVYPPDWDGVPPGWNGRINTIPAPLVNDIQNKTDIREDGGNWTACYKYQVHCFTDYDTLSEWEFCEHYVKYPDGEVHVWTTNEELNPAACPPPEVIESWPAVRCAECD